MLGCSNIYPREKCYRVRDFTLQDIVGCCRERCSKCRITNLPTLIDILPTFVHESSVGKENHSSTTSSRWNTQDGGFYWNRSYFQYFRFKSWYRGSLYFRALNLETSHAITVWSGPIWAISHGRKVNSSEVLLRWGLLVTSSMWSGFLVCMVGPKVPTPQCLGRKLPRPKPEILSEPFGFLWPLGGPEDLLRSD